MQAARIPRKHRAQLLERWNIEQLTGPHIKAWLDCPLCIEAVECKGNLLSPDEEAVASQCEYCPAEWPDGLGAGRNRAPCEAFMARALGDPILERGILNSATAKARRRPATREEYEEARRRVLAQVEWVD